MKKIYILFFALFSAVSLLSAKNDKDVAYLFGVSFSHNDSIVYFTEIQPLEGLKLQSRSRILPDRQHYAYELKDYMNFTEGKPGRTSAIYFAKSRKKLEKVEAKIKRRFCIRTKALCAIWVISSVSHFLHNEILSNCSFLCVANVAACVGV